ADPLVTAIEIVEPPLPPTGTVKLDGFALIEKSSCTDEETISVTVVECVALLPVPVTVNVYVAAAAVPAFTDNVDDPPAVTDVGFSDAVAPKGTPATDKLPLCAEPLVTAVEIVEPPLTP